MTDQTLDITNHTKRIETLLTKIFDIEMQIVMLKYITILMGMACVYQFPDLLYVLKVVTFCQVILVVSAVAVA